MKFTFVQSARTWMSELFSISVGDDGLFTLLDSRTGNRYPGVESFSACVRMAEQLREFTCDFCGKTTISSFMDKRKARRKFCTDACRVADFRKRKESQ